ncbi:OmpA family protein [Methylomonas sp. AM2-LC]|uniref:OmpA family protein n=1 Tax=Methylomonas sp. AM2-LC TaxID=3153301 RepID=UPI003263C6B1
MCKKRLLLFVAFLPLITIANAEAPYHAEPIFAADISPKPYYPTVSSAPLNFNTPSSKTVTVQFQNNGRVFRPSYSDEQELVNAAEAALITVRGRTSTIAAGRKDESLGLSRAMSARKYLIDHGVSPLKVSINYAPGDFVADNSTPGGRLENQRVEIELVYVAPFATN